jgi:hypothetical protein
MVWIAKSPAPPTMAINIAENKNPAKSLILRVCGEWKDVFMATFSLQGSAETVYETNQKQGPKKWFNMLTYFSLIYN